MTNLKRRIATLLLAAWILSAMSALLGVRPVHAATKELSGCNQIRTAAQLQAMQNNLAGSYCLMNDIDAGSIANFMPVGSLATPFTGRFYGNGHVIRSLKINNATLSGVGLFGSTMDAVIQDVGLADVEILSSIASYAGALVGYIQTGTQNAKVEHAYSTGRVRCTASVANCLNGGLIGIATGEISDVWSSAAVTGGYAVAGLMAAIVGTSSVRRSYATGDVICVGSTCAAAGGLVGQVSTGNLVVDSYATGKVSSAGGSLGGFAGLVLSGGNVVNVYATGAVVGGPSTVAGGLIGSFSGGTARSCFAAGPVQGGSGASLGGLAGGAGAPTVTNCYWDTDTTGQMASAGGLGTGRTTTQLRNALPAGLANGAWGINKTKSYPFINSDGFSSNLATLVLASKVYTALPLMQSDKSQYLGNPAHADAASLATVFTMVARAIGQTLGVGQLDNVKIDRFFWIDSTQTTKFRGPIKLHANLSVIKPIAPNAPLGTTNVIGKLNQQNWVVLRGSYTKPGGGQGTHYMLATLYTRKGASVDLVIANDPATGEQVAIDPVTKRVVLPPRYPLAGFKVTGYAVISNIH